jgi:alkylhydroperoxidase/carboxymuconolactone decarboxylase family protein YurZ
MTPSQSNRLAKVLQSLQDLRRVLDKEAAQGMTGIGANFGTEIDINDAIFGVIYAEKALARIWEREGYVRGLPDKTRELIRLKPKTMTRR